jgi:glycosyltransferase involved in cell wall biosynthesis
MLARGFVTLSNNKLKVHIVGTAGIPASYGGFETLTENLCKELASQCDFTVYCSSVKKSVRLKSYLGAKLVHIPLKANGWQSVPYDCLTLLIASFRADVILMLGYSGAFVMPFLKLFGKKVICNIGGTDSTREKWGSVTQRIIRLFEYLTVKNSTRLVVDNQYIKEKYLSEFSKDPELIAYGGDHVIANNNTNAFLEQYPFLDDDYCLSLSRAQEDNNIHILLHAFRELSDVKLVVISNWFTSDYGKDLYESYSNFGDNIILLDAIYDQEILDVIRSNARLYIHTHSACGTAPSLVEAMYLNLPVFCFDCEANRYSTDGFSKYFSDAEELGVLIRKYYHPPFLETISKKLSRLAREKYTWRQVAKSYLQLFS